MRFAEIVEQFKLIQNDNDDVMVGISGAKGTGKSTLGVKIGIHSTRLHNKMVGQGIFPEKISFNLSKNLPYTNKEVIRAAQDSEHIQNFSCLVIDEAIKSVFGRDFARNENKEMIKEFTTNRLRRLITCWLIPNIMNIDKAMRELLDYHLMIVWKDHDNKCKVAVFEKDRGARSDVWDLETWKKIMPKIPHVGYNSTKAEADHMVRLLRRLKTFQGCFYFKPLPENYYEKYARVRQEGVLRRDNELFGGSEVAMELDVYKAIVKNVSKLARKRGDKTKLYNILCKTLDGKGYFIKRDKFYQFIK